MHRVALALFTLILSSGGLARAKKPAADKDAPVRRFDFDDDQVEAGRALPLYEVVEARAAVRHASLVQPRTTFVPELLKSAEDH